MSSIYRYSGITNLRWPKIILLDLLVPANAVGSISARFPDFQQNPEANSGTGIPEKGSKSRGGGQDSGIFYDWASASWRDPTSQVGFPCITNSSLSSMESLSSVHYRPCSKHLQVSLSMPHRKAPGTHRETMVSHGGTVQMTQTDPASVNPSLIVKEKASINRGILLSSYLSRNSVRNSRAHRRFPSSGPAPFLPILPSTLRSSRWRGNSGSRCSGNWRNHCCGTWVRLPAGRTAPCGESTWRRSTLTARR